MRIATLLPSATEIVCALGLGDKLVGISHSCSYPPEIASVPRMTSTHVPFEADSKTIDAYVRDHLSGHEALYDLDLAALEAAQPDVVVSQALCDVCAVATGDVLDAVQSLPGCPALVDLTPNTLEDVFTDIERVGAATGVGDSAAAFVSSLRARCTRVRKQTAAIPESERPRVAFLEWLVPPFNGGHWNPELVAIAGGIDLLGAPGQPSSTQNWDHIAATAPDVVFIACCGLREERALLDVAELDDHPVWRELPAVRNGRVYVTDGNAYFASPSPRLIDGLEIMAHALHPGVVPVPATGACRQLKP